MLLGTQWTLYSDKLVLRRPGAKTLELQRSDIFEVRRESISGFGTSEPIYVFEDARHHLVFWTVARSWKEGDLRDLWQRLGVEPIDAQRDVLPFETLPYDRRF